MTYIKVKKQYPSGRGPATLSFFKLPHFILNSLEYTSLRPVARALLCQLGGQYNGRNNGDLHLAENPMAKLGWKRDQLRKAIADLESSGLIRKTRPQTSRKAPCLYALAWQPIDAEPVKLPAKLRSQSRLQLPGDKGKKSKFTQVLKIVLSHPEYLALGKPAQALLWEVAAQYNGHNNGELLLTHAHFGPRGWTKPALKKARDELLNADWLRLTCCPLSRAGSAPLHYALSWQPLDTDVERPEPYRVRNLNR
ncbi:hypothetical protein SAMN04488540_11014 [Ferrimonas sediminum]|uniref:Uncharacterized protein n=1 Tax=Ferrimonas sediminum TaxID=718193 RepID=A0A1G8UXS6_9GAMM|nr:hypothetical protein [Ferrimonas sediminum]SDJ57895.1 hypothetical protein SAMN04488540_11014 [Ferrimonas sediminum]